MVVFNEVFVGEVVSYKQVIEVDFDLLALLVEIYAFTLITCHLSHLRTFSSRD